jgi:hypothetical protein
LSSSIVHSKILAWSKNLKLAVTASDRHTGRAEAGVSRWLRALAVPLSGRRTVGET